MTIQERLEEIRASIEAENVSYDELIELQALADQIDPGDVQLLEAAGVPEFPEDDATWIVSVTLTKYDGHTAETVFTDEIDNAFTDYDEADEFHRRVLTHGYDILYTGEHLPGHNCAKDR